MSWMSRALETYEKNIGLAGSVEEGADTLLPLAHMAFKTQLEITINQDGDFITAAKVDEKDCSTIIPVTEASGGRSSGQAPHPLNDTLSYIAGDYSRYSEKDCSKKNLKYMENLEKWALSEFSHPKAKAVYDYVSKEYVMGDLIACGLVGLTEEGKLDNRKIQKMEYEKTLVRFRVIDAANPADEDATWKDKSLMDAYVNFYMSALSGKEDICYLTGKKAVITENHPKGVVAAAFGAKLISANDKVNFTFRGRFANAPEACVISYEASQKAHAALAWLSRNQGIVIGNKLKRTYICWTPGGKEVKVFKKNIASFKRSEPEDDVPKTSLEYKEKLEKVFRGYASELIGDNEDIIIIGLDAATTGRLSITYYNEWKSPDFLRTMKIWEGTCRWYCMNMLGKRIVRTPSIQQIVKAAFGSEQGEFIELDDKILKKQVERMLICMTEDAPLPGDLVQALFVKASRPQNYKNWYNREGVLSAACAVTAKFHNDLSRREGKGEKFKMELDKDMQDKSYQFGRLLAVLEKAEKYVLFQKNEDREANAIRMQTAFVRHPMTTWKVLEEALLPYYQQMPADKEEFYKRKISQITAALTEGYIDNLQKMETELNQPLKATYLIGYYLQRNELS